jgi:hypothetical protein
MHKKQTIMFFFPPDSECQSALEEILYQPVTGIFVSAICRFPQK